MYIRRMIRRAIEVYAHALVSAQAKRSKSAKLTAIIQHDGDWYVGWIEELPGVNTQGATLEEVRENLIDAAEMLIESNREDARRITQGVDVRREELLVAM